MAEQSPRESSEEKEPRTEVEGTEFEGVTRVFETVAATARVQSVFGEPYTAAGSTVIPVADVMNGLGFGLGSGSGGGPDGQGGRGSGAGGGAGARARPVALVVIDQQGVRVQPVIDIARLSLAGMATFGFLAVWLLRVLRAGQGGPNAKSLPSARAFQSLLKAGE